MLNLGIAVDRPLSRQALLSRVSESQIYQFYLGPGARAGSTIRSPFHADKNPSFSLYEASLHNKLMWKDQSSGNFGDVFDLVALLHQTDLYGALIQINSDFQLGFLVPEHYVAKVPIRKINTAKRTTEGVAKIGIKAYKWSPGSLWYWARYGISQTLLEFYQVYPARWVTLNDKQYWVWKPNSPVFGYLFHKDGVYTWKIYRPLASKQEGRWISNTNPSVLQGWDQLPRVGRRLIITKSLKDVMVLRTLGEFSLAMQQEVSTIKPSVMNELQSRFEEIWILQDFDRAGVIGANKMRHLYPKVTPFFIQDFKTRTNGLKDISDYREVHTLEETKTHLYKSMQAWRRSLVPASEP